MPFKDPTLPKNIDSARASRRKHYRNNKQAYIDRAIAKKKEMWRIYLEAKARPCADCGVPYPSWVMQFDHLGDKTDLVSKFVTRGNVARLLAEIKKCDVVCANCHAQRTHDRLVSGEKPNKEPHPTLF